MFQRMIDDFKASTGTALRLKSLVADLSLSNELLREKIHRREAGRPWVWRRPKP